MDKEIQFDQQVYYFQELVTKYVADLHKAPYYIFMVQDQIIEQWLNTDTFTEWSKSY